MQNAERILVVDDEVAICEFLEDYLSTSGFHVFTANNGDEMRAVISSETVDLVILDLMMSGEDGLTLTRYLRENSDVAIIILTGKDDEVDRVVGLEMGADDYMAKPFSSRELLARIKTVLRRAGAGAKSGAGDETAVKRFAGWEFDKIARQLRLLEVLQNRSWEPYDRSIDVLVGRLRSKIESNPRKPDLIKTVRGTGYVLATTVEDVASQESAA